MKVGLLTTGFPRFEGDHSGRFLLTLARGLVDHGHRVQVLAPEPAYRATPPRWPGIDVRWVSYLRPRRLQQTFYGDGAPENLRGRPERWAGAASYGAALAAASLSLADCDSLVSSWCLPSGWIASTIAGGRDHLCLCHATDLRWLARIPGRRRVARTLARGATSMWFLSSAHRDAFASIAALEPASLATHVGSMPVEAPRATQSSRTELRRRLGIAGPTVLFLGRLVPVKGADLLLRALAGCDRPIAARIAGDGPGRGELEALARSLGVSATFEGWVFGERKDALLRACDAMVVPSRQGDGLPTVLFEAKAYGLPRVATRVGAIADRLRDDPNVRLVACEDESALRVAITALLGGGHGMTRSVPLGGR